MNSGFPNYLSIDSSLKPTNEDIIVTFTPPETVISYEYRILKNADEFLTTNNGELSNPSIIYRDYIQVNTNRPTDIILNESGVYKIEIAILDYMGNSKIISSGNYVIDKESPKINISNFNSQTIEYKIGESNLEILNNISAIDNYSGDVSSNLKSNYNELDLTTEGLQKLIYTVSDEAGNIATKTININVIETNLSIIHMLQIILVIGLIPVIIYLFIYNRSIKLEKRLSKYSIEPIKKYSFSVLDRLIIIYKRVIDYIKPIVSKSVFITKHSKRYDKYVGIVDKFHNDSMELICSKIVVSIITLLLAFFSKIIQFKLLAFEEFFIPIILGYFFLDIIYLIKYKQYRKGLENDLLQAIIVMNNAFKSGRSITQAIELVTIELDGPIADEFKLMHMQLQFGLALDIAFSKFAERVNIEEVNYLTASLSILNKTGGNIIKVFSSIEKTLFNKKKLKLELNSLTGSSRIIMYLLTALPVFLVIVITLVNPDYFLGLYTTPIGLIILTIILIIYVSYIIVVKKLMKVRM